MESAKKREETALYYSATQGESSDEESLLVSNTKDSIPNIPEHQINNNLLREEISTGDTNQVEHSQSADHEILVNINKKINLLDAEFKILSQAMQESITDIYTEMLTLKKMFNNISNDKKISKTTTNSEYFPIHNKKEFNLINLKLANEIFFQNVKTNLIKQLDNDDDNCESSKNFFKKILPLIFHKSYIMSVTWVAHEGKTAISSSKLIDLIQSK